MSVLVIRSDLSTYQPARLAGVALTASSAVVIGSFVHWLANSSGLPQALDFDAFWSAAALALQGDARLLYDNRVIEAFERAHTTLSAPGYLAFYYPPPFLLLCLPLGLLPYLWALVVFLTAQAALLLTMLRRILPQAWAWLPICACPGFLMNALSGQNGGFSAACFGGGMLLLDRRPMLGGACLGALVCKPQLALCVPVALVAGRRWKALAGFVASALALAALSTAVFGTGAWEGFLANAPAARADLENLPGKWPLMQSTYAAIRQLGGGVGLAYVVQAIVAFSALAILMRVCARRRGAGPEMAAAALVALLATPFLYDYDLVLLAVPVAWMVADAQRAGWRRYEQPVLLALYLLPLGARAIGLTIGLQVAPLLVLAGLAVLASKQAGGTSRVSVLSHDAPPDPCFYKSAGVWGGAVPPVLAYEPLNQL